VNGYKNKWRTLRKDGKVKTFPTEEATREAAIKFAKIDGTWVGIERWENDHTVGDGLNDGWGLVGSVEPPTPGTVTLILSKVQAEALLSSIDSAVRGRADFDYLAGLDQNDYDPEDIENARVWHAREVEVEHVVAKQIQGQTSGA
jgi:hypothetical protein